MTVDISRYYVYTLARPNGKVFYVGKGIGDRVNNHEREAARGHKCHKCNVIRKIWNDGGQIVKNKVFFDLSEQEAYNQEGLLIAHYGLNNLTNVDPGKSVDLDKIDEWVIRRRHARPLWQLNAVEYRALCIRLGYSKSKIKREMYNYHKQQIDDMWRERQRAIITHNQERKARAQEAMDAARIACGRHPCQEVLPFDDLHDNG